MPSEKLFTKGRNKMCNDELWTARDAKSSEDEVGDFFTQRGVSLFGNYEI